MKHRRLILLVLSLFIVKARSQDFPQKSVELLQEEISEIIQSKNSYVYFGPEVCSIMQDLPYLKNYSTNDEHINAVCSRIQKGYKTAQRDVVEASLVEALGVLEQVKDQLPSQYVETIAHNLEDYYHQLVSGHVTIQWENSSAPQKVRSIEDDPIFTEDVFIVSDSNDENSFCLKFEKSREGGLVQNNDQLGCIEFLGHDGVAFRDAAAIRVHVDGVPGADDMPGRIEFYTTPDGSATSLERVRITEAGLVGIGTIAPTEQLEITGNFKLPQTTATTGIIKMDANNFVHAFGTNNFFAGEDAGNLATTGTQLVGVGFQALLSNTSGSQNTAVGCKALISNTSGIYNTGVGRAALGDNTTGIQNTAVGREALRLNNTGINNTAVGYNALHLNTSGTENTAVGAGALEFNTTGIQNTAVGLNALSTNTSGVFNTAIGRAALGANTTGIQNTAVGREALRLNNTGINNTAVGYNALHLNTSGQLNTAVGASALQSNATGAQNIAIGANSLSANTSGSQNIAIGVNALAANTITNNNVAVGNNTLTSNNFGIQNIAIGSSALLSNTAGRNNIAVGTLSLTSNTTGVQNIAIGSSALQSNTSGHQNVAVGTSALVSNVTGNSNTALGNTTLTFLQSGDFNVALGASALATINGASENVAVGVQAMAVGATGNRNTAVGRLALLNTAASSNVGVGYQALRTNTTGELNTAIGFNALQNAVTGSNNIAVGANSGAALTAGGSNNICIGNAGVAAESNTIRIGTHGAGSAQQSACFIAGIRGVTTGLNDVAVVFIDSAHQLGTISSSARVKQDVVDMGDSTNVLMKLRPVRFHYINNPEAPLDYGLIAEEVEKICPELVMYKDGQPEGVRYHILPAMILNEMQKQQNIIQEQAKVIKNLQRLVGSLQMRIQNVENNMK